MRRFLPDLASAMALLVAVPVARGPISSFDLFFHLASGRWILAHGFPSADPFSVTARTAQFPHEWGFGVLAELSVRWLGASGPLLLTASLVALTFFALWAALGPASERGLAVSVAFVLALVSQSFSWTQERPFHIGHLFFALTLWSLRRWREGQARSLWALVPLAALWANLHASWVLLPGLIGLTAIGAWIEGDPAQRRRALTAMIPAIACFAIAALSPAGPRIYFYSVQHALLSSTGTIQEWAPMQVNDAPARAFIALLVWTAVLAGRARGPRAWHLLPSTVLALAALGARRHSTFAGMALAASIAQLAATAEFAWPAAVAGALGKLDRALGHWNGTTRGRLLPVVCLLVIAVGAARHPQPIRDRILAQSYPLAALDALAKLPPGKVLNRFRWGGAIQYIDGPDYKVFIDGRNDPFPMKIFDAYDGFLNLDPGWQKRLADYDPDYILWGHVERGNGLLEALACMGGWRVAASDPVGVLLVKDASVPPAPR